MNMHYPTTKRVLFAVSIAVLPIITLAAWTPPSGTPPANNASEPINVSATDQFKQGVFGAKTLNVFGTSQYLSFGNTVGATVPGIRFNTTTSKLEFSHDGSTWSALGGGSASQWTTSGSDIYYNTGNVGVGVAPSAKLHIQSARGGEIGIGQQNDATPYMRLGMDTGWIQFVANNAYWTGSAYNYVNTGGYGGLASRMAQVSGTIQFDTASGGTNPISWQTRMYMKNDGTVGIGTTGPSAKLTVGSAAGSANQSYYDIGADKIAANTSIYSYGRICAGNSAGNCQGTGGVVLESTGNVTAAGYFHNSDAQLKKNIETMHGLEVISKLRGVRFDWKRDGSPSAGVIAQEVEQVMPSAVHTDAAGIKSVDYDQLIAPLIEAVKEQQMELRAQQELINSLQHEISTRTPHH